MKNRYLLLFLISKLCFGWGWNEAKADQSGTVTSWYPLFTLYQNAGWQVAHVTGLGKDIHLYKHDGQAASISTKIGVETIGGGISWWGTFLWSEDMGGLGLQFAKDNDPYESKEVEFPHGSYTNYDNVGWIRYDAWASTQSGTYHPIIRFRTAQNGWGQKSYFKRVNVFVHKALRIRVHDIDLGQREKGVFNRADIELGSSPIEVYGTENRDISITVPNSVSIQNSKGNTIAVLPRLFTQGQNRGNILNARINGVGTYSGAALKILTPGVPVPGIVSGAYNGTVQVNIRYM